MRIITRFLWIMAIVAAIGVGFIACTNPSGLEPDELGPVEPVPENNLPPNTEIVLNLVDMDEWALTEQTVRATANINKVFTVNGTYAAYQWYLDGTLVGTSSSYLFNKPAQTYQLTVIVTNSNGVNRSGRCRITAIPPIFIENFEDAAHSFTIVNGSQTNKWHVGDAVAAGGAKSVYISNDNGVSNAYTITAPSRVHLYRDIKFPASTVPYTLSFNWRVQGSYSDYLQVHLVETSTLITAGNPPSAGTILGTYYLGGTSWNMANITIPMPNSGTTKRLVFTWSNSNTGGASPPAAIDNIMLIYGN